MLRKKDLVKQFELVVKQEIIDHNKSIEANNLAINKHKSFVNEEIGKLKENHKLLVNEYALVSRQFSNVSSETCKLFNRIAKSECEFYKITERTSKKLQDMSNALLSYKTSNEMFEIRLNGLRSDIRSLRKELKLLSNKDKASEEKTRNSLTAATKRLKKEMLDIPCEAGKVRDEFMKELSMHKLDNEGLLKEIKVLKKTNFINEKKIENLYTLIDRLTLVVKGE